MRKPSHIAIDIADNVTQVRELYRLMNWILSMENNWGEHPAMSGIDLALEKLDTLVPTLDELVQELHATLTEQKPESDMDRS
ncbi:hypothetical protein ACN4EG_13650 [Alkalinema pantanalense CENA528]|uniref:hypothetical protein n=1 Tax=Alkalinema pantanalense TaxID=1620705 RepID=UPI003D6EF5F3